MLLQPRERYRLRRRLEGASPTGASEVGAWGARSWGRRRGIAAEGTAALRRPGTPDTIIVEAAGRGNLATWPDALAFRAKHVAMLPPGR